MRVALVYDRITKWGGAERVLLTLHKMFPEAPLYTPIYNAQKAPWAKVFPKIISSRLKGKHELLGWLMPLVFESFDFKSYDLVISVTSEAAKGILTGPGTRHICYCLTPTRYLWSGYATYFSNPILKFMTKPVINYLRTWDKLASFRPDTMIAISNTVKARIKNYYGRDVEVIYPPVDVLKFKKHLAANYYLVVSRLVKYKRVDLVIKAFNRLNLPLVIVGTGREEARLKSLAKKNIKFLGQVSEDKLVKIYREAIALIFPQEEDFGLTAVEAQSSGVPVIAFRKGGALETVVDGKTGVFFDSQSESSLIGIIQKFAKMSFREQDLIVNANRFSDRVFATKFLGIINNH